MADMEKIALSLAPREFELRSMSEPITSGSDSPSSDLIQEPIQSSALHEANLQLRQTQREMVLRLPLEPFPLIRLLRWREVDVEAHDQARDRGAYVHQCEGSADAGVGTCVGRSLVRGWG